MEDLHIHISARHNLFDLKIKEVWRYRDLILLFVRRNFVVTYKQTILGPLWLFVNPLMTCLVYTILFGHIAKLGTDGIPEMLFYLTGNALWTFFSQCLTNNASTFTSNAHLFGKVYFPRLTIPVASVISAAIRFMIQLILVFAFLLYYICMGSVRTNLFAWLMIPVVLLWLGILGMGCGIIVSSLTTKYRDLSVLVGFGVQLWLYGTPVVYPLSKLSGIIRKIVLLNPVTMPMEIFRYALLGTGTIRLDYITVSLLMTLMVALTGIIIFNKVERTFMDTV